MHTPIGVKPVAGSKAVSYTHLAAPEDDAADKTDQQQRP